MVDLRRRATQAQPAEITILAETGAPIPCRQSKIELSAEIRGVPVALIHYHTSLIQELLKSTTLCWIVFPLSRQRYTA